MAVAIAASTLGRFKTFTSTNATLATALSEVLNELETHNISDNRIKFNMVFDDTGQEFTVVAICKS